VADSSVGSKLLIAVALAAVVAAAVIGFQYSSLRAAVELERVRTELAVVQAQRESVEALAQRNDSLQLVLSNVRGQLDAEVDRREDAVRRLEQQRADTIWALQSLRQTSDIAAEFARTFPEVTAAPWGIQEVAFADRGGVELEMVMFHTSILDQFLQEHADMVSFRAQRDTLQSVVVLQDSIRTLSDSIFTLERITRTSFEGAYNDVFDQYTDLNLRYQDEVAKPRFGVNVPTFGTIIAAGAVGLLIGNRE